MIERVPINEQHQQPLTLPLTMDKIVFYNELWNVDPDGLTKMSVTGYVNAFSPMFPFFVPEGFFGFHGVFCGYGFFIHYHFESHTMWQMFWLNLMDLLAVAATVAMYTFLICS